jgi:hypothetical protein
MDGRDGTSWTAATTVALAVAVRVAQTGKDLGSSSSSSGISQVLNRGNCFLSGLKQTRKRVLAGFVWTVEKVSAKRANRK